MELQQTKADVTSAGKWDLGTACRVAGGEHVCIPELESRGSVPAYTTHLPALAVSGDKLHPRSLGIVQ